MSARFKGFVVVAALSMATFMVTSKADAQAKGYAGGFLGLSVPDADGSSARPMFGILGGARLDGEFGIGGFYLSSAKKETINNVEVDFDYNLYGLEGSFHFENVADGAFVAARVGISKVKAGTTNYSPMVWGLVFGYDHMLSENFSLGGEGGFMAVSGEDKSGSNLDGFTMLNFAAAAKFWF